MDEKQETVQSHPYSPQPAANLRESLLQRISPRFAPTQGNTGDPAVNGTDNVQSPTRTRFEGLKRHLPSSRPGPHRAQSNIDFPQDMPITSEHKLEDFRRLVGIDSSPSHTLSSGYSRIAENVGIYTHVVRAETACMSKYQRYSILINASLGMQLIFAAALTALGAGDGPRTAVTAFGAINTVLAGILTFLKGSGLPNREKYYAGEWRKLRDHIEQREREFGRVGCPLDVDTEMRLIEAIYHEVKQDVEANTPDGFTSVAAKRLVGSMGQQQSSGLPYPSQTPRALEAGYEQNAAPQIASPTTYQQQTPVPNALERLNSQFDPSSKAGQVLSKLTSLHAKYGDTILDKLTHLDHHDSIEKASANLSSTHRDLNNTVDRTVSSTQNLAQSHINATSNLISNEASRLAAAGAHAQAAGQTAARELAEHTTNTARETMQGLQDQAGRAAEATQHEADRLVAVGKQAENAARNIAKGVGDELRGFMRKNE